MIFATIGTTARFDRLLSALTHLDAAEELVVQCGDSSVRPAGATCVEFLSYDRLVELIGAASVVVAHAGVGTILTCLANGKRPIIVPRLARFGEAVDDHQVELSARLEQLGIVTVVGDPGELPTAIESAPRHLTPGRLGAAPELVSSIRSFVESEVAARSAHPQSLEPSGS
jgi:exopolysaccharide biosynthesis glucuronosyltransferase PssE